jgi:hypothetical protein
MPVLQFDLIDAALPHNEVAVGMAVDVATLYAGIRADMLDAPYMRDFLLTAKDTSFSTLDGVSAVR